MPGITAASSPAPATQAIISVEIGRTAPCTAPAINGVQPPHHIPTTRPFRAANVSNTPAFPAHRPPPAPPTPPRGRAPKSPARGPMYVPRAPRPPAAAGACARHGLSRPPASWPATRHKKRLHMRAPKTASIVGTHMQRTLRRLQRPLRHPPKTWAPRTHALQNPPLAPPPPAPSLPRHLPKTWAPHARMLPDPPAHSAGTSGHRHQALRTLPRTPPVLRPDPIAEHRTKMRSQHTDVVDQEERAFMGRGGAAGRDGRDGWARVGGRGQGWVRVSGVQGDGHEARLGGGAREVWDVGKGWARLSGPGRDGRSA
ncbi:hypothetical protein B0H14DRAFT_3445825 [Mycena olivaceomarginata]|nr:hypothetical protein B0H14DRAFT_3445825 [Mycena olivaceomarginata]